mmetsp:Transcript_78222/g.203257  ORF Transcript_78222/g.203257 Transcript_78222/m.203257 type:complete len:90 (+) Transcript_78222:1114-1383(+)
MFTKWKSCGSPECISPENSLIHVTSSEVNRQRTALVEHDFMTCTPSLRRCLIGCLDMWVAILLCAQPCKAFGHDITQCTQVLHAGFVLG